MRPARLRRASPCHGPIALVAGDRQTDGIFPLWSIADNITIRSLPALTKGPLISPRPRRGTRERLEAAHRHPHAGHEQQHPVALRRQPAEGAVCPGARARMPTIILMDDPMRGVDIGTKLDVYGSSETRPPAAARFLWYTTEMDELEHCRSGLYLPQPARSSPSSGGDELTEERVIHSSFQEAV